MKNIDFSKVKLQSGYWFSREKMKKFKQSIIMLTSLLLLFSGPIVHAENEQVRISQREYSITVTGHDCFFGNNTPVSGKVGSKVFLTYTVEKVRENTAEQNGVAAALDVSKQYVWTNGGSLYYSGSQFFEEGYTYAFRFERTEEGFEFEAIRLKGDESERLIIPAHAGEQDGEFRHYGIWIGGLPGQNLDVDLTHLRCYDEKGNDLGIYPHQTEIDGLVSNELLDKHLVMDHSYDFTIEDKMNIAISNKKPVPDSDAVIYMEYEMGKVEKDESAQSGLIVTRKPDAWWPYTEDNGYMRYGAPGKYTKEGAKYFICFQKTEDGFKGTVQCTADGKTETFSFGGLAGTYDSNYAYYTFWIGQGGRVTCEVKNFKCYDAEGNNLGIQFNQDGIFESHNGPIEDYSATEAVYYCEENETILVLRDGKAAYKESAGVKEKAEYRIVDNRLTLSYENGKEGYTYTYMRITDEGGNVYKRLHSAKVTFVTGEKEIVKKANAENGYRVEKPENPTKDSDTFQGWFLADGTEYDFDKIVTESVTVYAKWRNGAGQEYLAAGSSLLGSAYAPAIAIGVSSLIVIAFALGCIILVKRRRNKNVENQQWKESK